MFVFSHLILFVLKGCQQTASRLKVWNCIYIYECVTRGGVSRCVWAPSGEVAPTWLQTRHVLAHEESRWQFFYVLSLARAFSQAVRNIAQNPRRDANESSQRSAALNYPFSDKVFGCSQANFGDNSIRQSYYGYVRSHFASAMSV